MTDSLTKPLSRAAVLQKLILALEFGQAGNAQF